MPCPREGIPKGRLVLVDPIPTDLRWGGFTSGDEVTMHCEEDCPCGWGGPRASKTIRRFAENEGGDDKITCAGSQQPIMSSWNSWRERRDGYGAGHPDLARGRVIMPGDDAVHIGRGGADFRQPDPQKHIHDLVLGDTAKLRDLHDTPMADIIDLLAELGKSCRSTTHVPPGKLCAGAESGRAVRSILRGVYEACRRCLRRHAACDG